MRKALIPAALALALMPISALPSLAAEEKGASAKAAGGEKAGEGKPGEKKPGEVKKGRPGATIDFPDLMAPLNNPDGKLIGYAYLSSRLTAASEKNALAVREKLP